MQKEFINKIPLKMHPRVFAALGADLVTNDIVAIIELVKNSYDAFASEVRINFDQTDTLFPHIEIRDNGSGMTEEIIDNVWCTVATPFKSENPVIQKDNKVRRVSGAKGLGRLSVARLGSALKMITKTENGDAWKVEVNWGDISAANSVNACYITRTLYNGPLAASDWHGTILQIYGLNKIWTSADYEELKENLGRLISPFSKPDDFRIYFKCPLNKDDAEIEIETPEFLNHPKYKISGNVNEDGVIQWQYVYNSLSGDGISRRSSGKWTFRQISDQEEMQQDTDAKEMRCGPFDFEIRAWDIGSDDILEIASNFQIQQRRTIRAAIRSHKGLSVYRDDVLVLPKSDNAKDWLGLDLRRVSKVGDRLSTSQLVGHINISADKNKGLMDTSDRERLAINIEYKHFTLILRAIVGMLENERSQDRIKIQREKTMEDLFSKLSAEDLLAEVISIAESGGSFDKTVPLLRDFSKKLESARETLQQRLIYYSRLATIGTIAQMLVHEIRNCTMVIAYALKLIVKSVEGQLSEKAQEFYKNAEKELDRLEHLSEVFLPLANRAFNSRKRTTVLSSEIQNCLDLISNDTKRLKIETDVLLPDEIQLEIDPAEFNSILMNLLSNAIYWIQQVPEDRRKIIIRATQLGTSRYLISVDDTGPGIPEEFVEQILWPGVTRKPNGIGMGLTVAAELVASRNGCLAVKHPGNLGGASFCFDLPVVTSTKGE